jgi:GNAT superfamily N-acetyltransferase
VVPELLDLARRHGIYLEDLYVTPAMRGRGLGKALLAELAATCVRRGYGRLEWWVLDWNAPAIGFYRSIGAEPMSEWTVQRLTGTALTALSDLAFGGRSP